MPTSQVLDVTSVDVASDAVGRGVDVSDLEFLPGLDALPRRADGTVDPLVLAAFLAGIELAGLDTDAAVLDVVIATDRLRGWLEALHLGAVAEFVRRPFMIGAAVDPVVARAARAPLGRIARDFGGGDEVGAALGLTVRGGEARVWTAVALAAQFPATAAALGAGRVDYPRMLAMIDEAAGCEPAHAAAVEAAVLARGRRDTPGQFRAAVRRAVIRTDPAAAKARAQAARADLFVRTGPSGTDTAWLDGHLRAEDAAAIRAVLDAAAAAMAREPHETRSKDQLRAAALAAPFWTALATGMLSTPDGPLNLPTSHAQMPAVVVTHDPNAGPSEPAHLHGYGPITGDLGRQIAARSRTGPRPLVRVLEPTTTGQAQVIADRWPAEPRYTPTVAMVRHVIARDHTCTHPACNQPAHRCDIDHTTPWPTGPTHPANTGPQCRRHHRLKQHPAVQVTQTSPGHYTWTMPTGHRYQVRPPADDP